MVTSPLPTKDPTHSLNTSGTIRFIFLKPKNRMDEDLSLKNCFKEIRIEKNICSINSYELEYILISQPQFELNAGKIPIHSPMKIK